MRKKHIIYIWGCGYYLDIVLDSLNKDLCLIKGLIDKNPSKHGRKWHEQYEIFSPDILLREQYDFVIISVKNYEAILDLYNQMDLDASKIVVAWNENENRHFIDYSILTSSAPDFEKQKERRRIENAPYELNQIESLTVRPSIESLSLIERNKVSLCRFGDGEFEIMRGNNRAWFQQHDELLAMRLREIVLSVDDNILIAIANNFGCLDQYTEEAADAIRDYVCNGSRDEIMKMINPEHIYYDAYVTRPYIIHKDKNMAIEIFAAFKRIWSHQDVLLVEGEYSKIGEGNDLFSSANSVTRFLCPSTNAFAEYEWILREVTKEMATARYSLILISLGPAATVLAYDLAKRGYWALDIGQLDNEYEWYLLGIDKRVEIKGKMTAEIPNPLEGFEPQKIILFGYGNKGKELTAKLHLSAHFELVEIWDNDKNKQNQLAFDMYQIKAPQNYTGIPIIIGVVDPTNEIKTELMQKYNFPEIALQDLNYVSEFNKSILIQKYKKNNEHEIQQVLSFLKSNDLVSYNYDFTQKYMNLDIDILWDKDAELFYSDLNGKNVYFKKSLDCEQKCLDYMRFILLEQDPESPHSYFAGDLPVKEGGVVIDAGAAEGIFGLAIIDRVERLYLIECDEEWHEALKFSFAPYGDRVSIIKKKLSDTVDDECITIDEIISGGRLDIVKMDIEGFESLAILGMNETINTQSDFLALVCAYHNSYDEVALNEQLSKMGLVTSYSHGYIYFEFFDEAIVKLTRCLIFAAKGDYTRIIEDSG